MKWLEADYFKSFCCKCGDCRQSCCDAWDIAISETEFHRLSCLSCSDSLFMKLQCAFREIDNPTSERYRVFGRNFIGCCPMHDSDGLCSLHKEVGADCLPEICRVFPRSMHKVGAIHRAVCSAGCEAVIEILDNQDRLTLVECEDDLPVDMESPSSIITPEHLSFLISIMQDRSYSIPDRLFNICLYFSPSLNQMERKLPDIPQFIQLITELSRYSPTLSAFIEETGERYTDSNSYLEDRRLFESKFSNIDHLFENLLVNHLVYEDFPETDARIKPEDSINGLCFTYALMRIFCISRCKGTISDIYDTLTNAFRYIEHSSLYYNARVTISDPLSLLLI